MHCKSGFGFHINTSFCLLHSAGHRRHREDNEGSAQACGGFWAQNDQSGSVSVAANTGPSLPLSAISEGRCDCLMCRNESDVIVLRLLVKRVSNTWAYLPDCMYLTRSQVKAGLSGIIVIAFWLWFQILALRYLTDLSLDTPSTTTSISVTWM